MDPDNVFQLLMSGQGDPSQAPSATNVMQQAVAPTPPPPPTFQDPTAPAQPADVAQAANTASPPMPRQRRSLLDTIGRISDVLATVGGAQALYQPTLDANTARTTAAQDHDLAMQKARQDLATSKFDLSDKQREAGNDERSRFASVLDAVNDPEDAGNLPAMMAAAGLTDPRYAPFVKMIQDNPENAKVLSGALGGGDASAKLGHNLYFGTNSDGRTVAYQIGDDGQPHILDFSGAGVTPGEPTKVVNTGGSNVVVGTQTGQVRRILPNTVSPNTVLTTNTQKEIAGNHDKTQITIAGMPARAKPGTTKGGGVADPNVPTLLDNIEQGFNDLHGMNALPGEGGALGQVEGAIGRTAIGQKIGEQVGSPAAQKRLEIMKNVSALQQAMLKSLPASATRTKFEQEMLARGLPDPSKMTLTTAHTVINQLRQSYAQAVSEIQAKQPKTSLSAADSSLPRLTPAQAAKLKPGTPFLSLDGRKLVRH